MQARECLIIFDPCFFFVFFSQAADGDSWPVRNHHQQEPTTGLGGRRVLSWERAACAESHARPPPPSWVRNTCRCRRTRTVHRSRAVGARWDRTKREPSRGKFRSSGSRIRRYNACPSLLRSQRRHARTDSLGFYDAALLSSNLARPPGFLRKHTNVRYSMPMQPRVAR